MKTKALLVCLLILGQVASGQTSFQAGQRVEVDIIMAGAPDRAMWKSGTVSKVEGSSAVVQLDDGRTMEIPLRADRTWIRELAAGPAPDAVAAPGAVSGAAAPGAFAPEQRVDVDVIMAGAPERAIWKSGTVMKLEGGDVHVRLDEGRVMTIPLTAGTWIRPSTGVAPAPVTAAPPPAEPAPAPAKPEPDQVPDKTAKPTERPALGAPPDGIYNCEKISGGMLIGLGKLEIRGGTYQGMAGGEFTPFTIDADNLITFPAGLTGLPEGTQLGQARYVGTDHQGHPLIYIDYRSPRGWKERIDAVLR